MAIEQNSLISEIYFSDLSYNRNVYDTCPITHEIFEDRTRISVIHKCGHYFSVEGLNTWCSQSNNCPICRCNIENFENNDLTYIPDYNPNNELLRYECYSLDITIKACAFVIDYFAFGLLIGPFFWNPYITT